MRDNIPSSESRTAAIAEYFGRLAHTYGDGEYYTRRRAAVVAALAGEIAGAHRILDLGCGNGRYLHELRAIAPDAIIAGADLSPEMLAQARIRNGPDTPLVRANASAVPFRTAVIDAIFASHVLPFVTDLETIVREVARCLAPGGVLIATIGAGGIRGKMRDLIGEERWSRLRAAVFGTARRFGERAGLEEAHREAFARAGLAPEIRSASFQVGWPGVEEWIQIRWMPVATDADRRDAAAILSEVAAICGAHIFSLEERLLVGRKPAR